MTIPKSLLPDNAATRSDGRLSVAGVDVLGIAAEYGTPAFVYDEDHIRARCQEARAAFGPEVAYAAKAFLCRAMAELVAEEDIGMDVATGGELHIALAGGMSPKRLTFHGNNKSRVELETALAAGVNRVVVDSFDEIERLADIGRSVQCLVRVTPGVEAHTHEYVQTGQDDSKFGFSLRNGDAAKAVEALRRSPKVELRGIHAHIGSQIFRVDSFQKAVGLLSEFFLPLDLPELCIGGGLGVAYVEGEVAPTITEWGEMVKKACADAGLPPSAVVTAEPGRSIVAGAGVTIYTVGTIKEIPGLRTYVSVDGGMSDNPRPILYGSGYETFLPRAVNAERPRTVTVVGKHCESGDVVVRDAKVPQDIVVGDVIATPVTGAYGHSMASTYNKVGRPPVLFVKDGKVREVVRRETNDDLLRLDRSLR